MFGRVSSKESDLNTRVNNMEQRLREKINVQCGFADPAIKAKRLATSFGHFDKSGNGTINYDDFFATMTQMNFVGVQRDLEALFNHYDDDASGTISYDEFASHIWGISKRPQLDGSSSNVIEQFKAKVLASGGAGGIHAARALLRRMDTDGSKTLDVDELGRGLGMLGITGVSKNELKKLFNYFDVDKSGRVSADEIVRGFSRGMSFERKQIVRQAFNKLDYNGSGAITVDDILATYDTSMHPDVAGGSKTPAEVAGDLLAWFEKGGDIDGVVTWVEFLDYYKGLSLSIANDNYFEAMMRNAWHISGGIGDAGNTTCRRVLVEFLDGTQEVHEILDDLGLKLDQASLMRVLQGQGLSNISRIVV